MVNIRSLPRPVALLFLFVGHALCQSNTTTVNYNDVVVRNLKLFAEGKEYVFKGMVYHPMPLGYGTVSKDGFGGGGLCSAKKTPWSEWKSACWDSDFYDGSDGSFQTPPGPKSWFEALWKRDFPLMKELGVNTIRLYTVNPTTRLATEQLLEEGWNDILEPLGKDHRRFLDYAQAYGIKVMFPLVGDETALSNDSDELLNQKIRNIIDEIGGHPALLMWVMGNEIDLSNPARAAVKARINEKMDFARNYTLVKWGRRLPITTCVVDLPESYDPLAKEMKVDVFCANAGYRSDSLTDLFSGNPGRKFSGWKKLCNETGKPLLIGELGWLSVNNTINHQQPQWFNKLWKDVLRYVDEGCVGGIYFEYSDEKYKQSGIDQTQLGVVELAEAVNSQGQSSTTSNVFIPDQAIRKEIIFDAVKKGVLAGVPMNFNMDIFSYLNRSQATIRTGPPPPTAPSTPLPAPDDDPTPTPEAAPQANPAPGGGGGSPIDSGAAALLRPATLLGLAFFVVLSLVSRLL